MCDIHSTKIYMWTDLSIRFELEESFKEIGRFYLIVYWNCWKYVSCFIELDWSDQQCSVAVTTMEWCIGQKYAAILKYVGK